ncbi:hypothetical protein KsCSTR_32610 [Candidatus Kuenenia stuttgartiensis]|uniref:Uncharacterized protein n=1 Tax=Kuenenia stuttgartiensis TaxID=174633 RepID=Q1Q4L8_KUEST|nr:hypothetical protein KsCSTR_32610 [Candidatus Kuenenia stuttgartiensis]CAJ74967.1 unknown protein [Candidatus Kuenenia stuttgartiensis]
MPPLLRQQSSFDPVCGAWERAIFFHRTKVLRLLEFFKKLMYYYFLVNRQF